MSNKTYTDLDFYCEGIQIVDRMLTKFSFTAEEKAAFFGRPGENWDSVVPSISAVINDDVFLRVRIVIDIASALHSLFGGNTKQPTEWEENSQKFISTAQNHYDGHSLKELMLKGKDGIMFVVHILGSITGNGPQFDPTTRPSDMRTIARRLMEKEM